MKMTDKQKLFLRKLADLCEEYNAEFSYTTDDDGIHIDVEGEEIFIGFMFNHPALELRTAADNWSRE